MVRGRDLPDPDVCTNEAIQLGSTACGLNGQGLGAALHGGSVV